MAYDGIGQRLLLFGGSSRAAMNDTWTFGAAGWSEIQTSLAPGRRALAAASTDPGNGSILLFGGSGVNDTWQWDGRWSQQTDSSAPPVLIDDTARMAFDPFAHAEILLGTPNSTLPNERPQVHAWQWTGTEWAAIAPSSTGPAPRLATALTTDPLDGGVLLFGGSGAGPGGVTDLNDTWLLKAGTWTQLTPPTKPSAGAAYAAFDEAQKVVVLLTQDGRTWTWSNSDWRLAASAGPAGRYYGSMAYDPAHQRSSMEERP